MRGLRGHPQDSKTAFGEILKPCPGEIWVKTHKFLLKLVDSPATSCYNFGLTQWIWTGGVPKCLLETLLSKKNYTHAKKNFDPCKKLFFIFDRKLLKY